MDFIVLQEQNETPKSNSKTEMAKQYSRKLISKINMNAICRYTTSGDGSRFFCLFNKKGFFSIGGNKDFIGVAI
jgi:hypothetical protein